MPEKQPATHLVQITDTSDRNAFLKIGSAYARHTDHYGLRADRVDIVAASSTLDIGVAASELVHNTERPERLILALNCAPPDKKDGTKDNARKDFFFADLGEGIFAGGTNNGFELSYLKSRIEKLYRLTTTNALRSQFRSLQILPRHIVRYCVEADRKALIESGELVLVSDNDIDAVVPDIPDLSHVLEVDSFDNVKLFVSAADAMLLNSAQAVDFGFGTESIEFDETQSIEIESRALVAPTLFAAELGTNILALNSSSRILGDRTVPMIATIRDRPAETDAAYTVPYVGQPVRLVRKS